MKTLAINQAARDLRQHVHRRAAPHDLARNRPASGRTTAASCARATCKHDMSSLRQVQLSVAGAGVVWPEEGPTCIAAANRHFG